MADLNKESISRLRPVLIPRAKTINDAARHLEPILNGPIQYENILCGLDKKTVTCIIKDVVNRVQTHSTDGLENFFRYKMTKKYGEKMKVVVQPVRVAITGKQVSLPLFEMMDVIGTEECLERLEKALNHVQI